MSLLLCTVVLALATPFANAFVDANYERDLMDRVDAAHAAREGVVVPSGPIAHCGTPLASEIRRAWPDLSADSRQRIASVLETERPILDEFHDTPDGLFRLHYSRTGPDSVDMSFGTGTGGVPNYVLQCVELLSIVVAREVDDLGFPFPVSDSTSDPTGEPRYDIYFQDLGFSFYGVTWPELLIEEPGEPAPWLTSYMVVHSDFRQIPPYSNQPFLAMAVTLAHEFHHASHWTIDAFESEVREGEAFPWFLETAATAMEELVFDDVNDYYAYLSSYFRFPWVSLRFFTSSINDPLVNHPYASMIWMLYLIEQHGEEILRDIWEVCGETPGFNTFEAFSTVLNQRGSSLEAEWAEFLVWNYFAGSRGAAATWGYEEGARYSGIPEEQIPTYNTYPVSDTVEASGFPRAVDEFGAQYLRFTPVFSDTATTFRFQLNPSGGFEDWMVVTAGLIQSAKPNIHYTRNTLDVIEVADWDQSEELLVILTPFIPNPLEEVLHRSLSYSFDVLDSLPASASATGVRKVFPNPLVLNGSGEESAFTIQVARGDTAEVTMHIYTTDGRLIMGGASDTDNQGGDVLFAPAGATNAILRWSGKNRNNKYVSSGIYLALVQIGNEKEIVKIAIKNGE